MRARKKYFVFVLYIAGLSSIGFVAGFFAGGSSSPVVGVALPLIFGLISGATGIYVTKSDMSNEIEMDKLGTVGVSLLFFSSMLWFGALNGTSSRTGKSITSLLTPSNSDISAITSSSTATEALALSLLKSRMQSLGIDNKSIEAVLVIASDEIRKKTKGLPESEIAGLVSEIDNAVSKLSEAPNQSTVSGLKKALLWESTLFESVAKTGYDSRSSQRLYLGELRKSTWSWLNSPDVNLLPDDVRNSLIRLHNKSMSLESSLNAPSWVGETPLTKDIDGFLSISSKQSGEADGSTPIFINRPHNGAIPEL